MAEQRRGNKKIRVGFRPDIAVTIRGEPEIVAQNALRRQKTPMQRAKEELSKELDRYNISDILKREYTSEASRVDTLSTMNMAVLAAVFVYLQDFPEPTPENFTDQTLDPYITQLMQDFPTTEKANAERNDVIHRYKQTLLRYILKIIDVRQKVEQVPTTVSFQEETRQNIEEEEE